MPTRAIVLALMVGTPGCFPGDECEPFVPGGSGQMRCDGEHRMFACMYDAASERYVLREDVCLDPYSCKDADAGARCTTGPEPYPACTADPTAAIACEGNLLVYCEDGNRVGHVQCVTCDFAARDICSGEIGDTDCTGDADCVPGAICIPGATQLSPSQCEMPCDDSCPEDDAPCPACLTVNTQDGGRCYTNDEGRFCVW